MAFLLNPYRFAGVGGWKEVARTTLGGAGTAVTVTGIPDKKYYMILSDLIDSGSLSHNAILNNDTGSNYASRRQRNGAADITAVSQANLAIQNVNGAWPRFSTAYLSNLAAKEKLLIHQQVGENGAGSAVAPDRVIATDKWANTSDPVDEYATTTVTNNFAAGSEVVVLGWDPDDIHTDNFWELLASVDASGASDLDTGTIATKKYLWLQCYFVQSAASHFQIRFNTDSSTNYSNRRSTNGAADVTDTSQSAIGINTNTSNKFLNMFIINNAANEKLCIYDLIEVGTAGAGNDPKRRNGVAKWINTSAQIDEMVMAVSGVGGLAQAGSKLRVWGSD